MKKIYSILCLFIVSLAVITSCSKDDEPTPTLSSLNSITSFQIIFDGVTSTEDVITKKSGENITISVPYQTNLSDLKPIIKISEKATVSPASGETVNFVDGEARTYKVTAEDGTVRTYNVTISTRGEVGSGSKLKTYLLVNNYSGLFDIDNKLTTYTYDETSKFVSEYSILDNINSKTLVYKFTYDNKNQITEKKCESEKEVSTFTYNDNGQIISSTDKKDDKLVYSYTYAYDANGYLTKTVRINEENKKETVYTFKNENGNTIEETVGTDKTTATFDNKNNPFKGLYPKSYAIIEAGIYKVNQNNPITLSIVDGNVTNEYNTDSYPVKVSYSSNGEVTVITTKTFTYSK